MGQLSAGKGKLSPDQLLLRWGQLPARTGKLSPEQLLLRWGQPTAGKGKLSPEQLLLRWDNFQLEKLSCDQISCYLGCSQCSATSLGEGTAVTGAANS